MGLADILKNATQNGLNSLGSITDNIKNVVTDNNTPTNAITDAINGEVSGQPQQSILMDEINKQTLPIEQPDTQQKMPWQDILNTASKSFADMQYPTTQPYKVQQYQMPQTQNKQYLGLSNLLKSVQR